MNGLKNQTVRFFVYKMTEGFDDLGDNEYDICEVDEAEFIENTEEHIVYERHTIFADGCDQVCLAKMPKG